MKITKYSVMREKLSLLIEYLLILEDVEDNRSLRLGENEFFIQLMKDSLMEAQILFGKGN
jgi:hypothetical protein